jgi:hypothetical protein
MKRFVKVGEPDLRYKGECGWGSNLFSSTQEHGDVPLPAGFVVWAGWDSQARGFRVRFPYLGTLAFPVRGISVSEPCPDGFGPVGGLAPAGGGCLSVINDNGRIKLGVQHFRGSENDRDIPRRDVYIYDTGYELREV